MKLYPTSTCFDDATDLLAQIIRDELIAFDSDEVLLVHGLLNSEGTVTAHAWIERGEDVYNVCLRAGRKVAAVFDRALYYEAFSITDCTRYTIQQAIDAEKAAGRHAPWEPRYLEHCKRKVSN